jgi:hypothetical protein
LFRALAGSDLNLIKAMMRTALHQRLHH